VLFIGDNMKLLTARDVIDCDRGQGSLRALFVMNNSYNFVRRVINHLTLVL